MDILPLVAGERVAVVRAETYESASLKAAVAQALDLLGGPERFVPRGAKVFVKVNLLPPPSPPERAIVTHPAFAEAVLTLLREITPRITVGDDVDGSESFEVTGYRRICDRLGVELINLRERGFVEVGVDGDVLEKIYIAKAVLEADVVVDLPKLKTHALTRFTGAVKNLYGIIPAGLRKRLHGDHPEPDEFCRVLVDILRVARPALTVMDAVVAMEGAGPANGTPRDLGLVIAGADAVAVDAVAQMIIGLDPLGVGTTRSAHARGLGIGDPAEIEVVGEGIATVRPEGFRFPPAVGEFMGRLPPALIRWIVGHLQARPVVTRGRCVSCGACVRACPVGAVNLRGEAARIDRRSCIRCMCCHEACRYGAIELVLDPLGRLFRSIGSHGLGRRKRQVSPAEGNNDG
ncbi:MAG: DUF362 domain-containing protein [Caldiserica bacterium]|nr:DUF362 domain-containing protein [Caldisericota bacterium]